mgnify:CR=1 FL=1
MLWHPCMCVSDCHDSMLAMRLTAKCLTAWMPVDEGWIAWIGTINRNASFKPTWEWQIAMFTKPTWGWHIHVLAYLRVARSIHFHTNKHEMFCSNLGDLVYTCVLCASHSNSRLMTGLSTYVFSKTRYHVSKGWSFTRRAGVLIAWPSPLVLKFPSRGNFGDDGHVDYLAPSQGYLNFPK